MNETNQTFIIIPESVQRIKSIEWTHRAIFGIVYAFSVNGGECWLTVDQIAERIHRKRRQTTSMIQTLVELGLIEIASFNGRKRSLKIAENWMDIQPDSTIEHVQSTARVQSTASMRNSAHVQSTAPQACEKPHHSHAEFRTSDMRPAAHLENKKEKNGEKNKSPDKKNSGSKPNTIDECREYFTELGSDDHAAFWDYWSSVGWKRRTGKIVCWKSTARNWVRRNQKTHGSQIDKTKPFDATNAFNWANQ